MVIKEEPFFSRVQPYDQWGAATTNPVLERYKKWLEEFKLQNQIKKHAKEEQQVCEDEKFQRVRDLTKKDREMIKKQRKNTNKQMKLLRKTYKMDKKIKCEVVILISRVQLTAKNLKKNQKREILQNNKKLKMIIKWIKNTKEIKRKNTKQNLFGR
ncbi:unnamed protein product [Paramecium sonneborni]|uniref:Uncharacterized protein n=1 Tax=Paramecium sonneborni TaxID=65129 RepID=A0A8S1PM57_9CILI|nr:unnamed protein product [Paramecium sonneborni]